MAHDPDCDISQFASLVERDVELTTELLLIANSAALGGRLHINSIHEAIVRLGLTQCRNLVVSSCVASLVKNLPAEHERTRNLLWKHAYTTAVACMFIDRSLRLGFQCEAFTAGLLHDFGRTLLAIGCPDICQQADPLDFVEDGNVLERERKILGSDHCVVGAWFASENHLTEELISAIRWHHQPEQKHEHQSLAALVAAGDHIANYLQRFKQPDGYSPEENSHRRFGDHGAWQHSRSV